VARNLRRIAAAAVLALACGAGLLAALAQAGPGPAAASKAKPVLFSKECADRHYKPKVILIACADARTSFEATEWVRWTSKEALAKGTLLRPDCPPATPIVACTKNTRDRNASVLLFRPRLCPKQGRAFFTRLRLRDPEAKEKYLHSIKLNFPCATVR
jgi:hypothetical protein